MTLHLGVTGPGGLLGWHLRCYLRSLGEPEPALASRETFGDPAALRRFVAPCGAIVHYAGVNRGDSAEVESANPAIARLLVQACEAEGVTPHVVFSSSVHVERDNPYGRGKRAASEILADWAARTGARFTNLVLPHVYGEGGRPFYNSVVSTFCHQLAHGEEPRIEVDGPVELLHAQDLSETVVEVIRTGRDGQLRPHGTPIASVSELLARLRSMAVSYEGHVFPTLASGFDVRLFNTLRSYMYPDRFPVVLPVRRDERGGLCEAVKGGSGGQTFVSWTRPGVTRGNHFHRFKVERFLVVRGRARIRIRKLYSDVTWSFDVDGDEPRYVDMPTLHTHAITNTGDDDLMTLFWANEIFDPGHPDTYAEDI